MQERPYQKLVTWREAHALCLCVYLHTRAFPPEEKFGLVSQMRRAAYSIPMNIAEGNGRRSRKDKVHFIEIAITSLDELHYQCYLAQSLHYLTEPVAANIDEAIRKTGYLLNQLRSSLI